MYYIKNLQTGQKVRAELLSERYPDLRTAYGLNMGLSLIFENKKVRCLDWPTWPDGIRKLSKVDSKLLIPLPDPYRIIIHPY